MLSYQLSWARNKGCHDYSKNFKLNFEKFAFCLKT